MPEPFFSIIVATYRRPAFLATCLQSLAHQDYPRDQFEVIVADDDGGLREEDVVGPVRGQLDISFLQPAHSGPAGARSAGAARARGRFLYFVDDDCRLAPDILQKLQTRLDQYPEAAVVGPLADAQPTNLWSAASQAQLDAVFSYYNSDAEHASFGAGANLAVPAKGFRKVGAFDASLWCAEDREFLDRWQRCGRMLVYAPEIALLHNHPATWPIFWRRNMGYGSGAFIFAQKRLAGGTSAPRVDWSFYRHFFTYALRTHQPHAWRVTGALLLARLAYTKGYLTAKRQARLASARKR